MAKRLRDKDGNIVAIELGQEEMAHTIGVEVEDLLQWTISVPPHTKRDDETIYRIANIQELNHFKKRVALLRTRMSEKAVANVEKAGLLDAYAALAEDCPTGITAHVWRSYALVVLMQIRYGKMIDAEELAVRAGLTETNDAGQVVPSVSMAKKHLRLLQATNKLKIGTDKWAGQWEHKGLPESWRGA
jgi:hypothetical protein